MHIKATYFTVEPGRRQTFSYVFAEEVVPLAESYSRCHFVLVLQSVENPREVIALSVWESREAAREFFTSDAIKRADAAIEHFLTGPTEVRSFECERDVRTLVF